MGHLLDRLRNLIRGGSVPPISLVADIHDLEGVEVWMRNEIAADNANNTQDFELPPNTAVIVEKVYWQHPQGAGATLTANANAMGTDLPFVREAGHAPTDALINTDKLEGWIFRNGTGATRRAVRFLVPAGGVGTQQRQRIAVQYRFLDSPTTAGLQ